MNLRQTVLSDNLQINLNEQAPEEWAFIVHEWIPDDPDDKNERVLVDFFSKEIIDRSLAVGKRPIGFPKGPCLRKAFYTEEVQRKKCLKNFANILIKQIKVALEKQ